MTIDVDEDSATAGLDVAIAAIDLKPALLEPQIIPQPSSSSSTTTTAANANSTSNSNLATIQSDFERYLIPQKPQPHLEVLFSITEVCDLIASHLYVYDVLNLRQASKTIRDALAGSGSAYRDLWIIGPETDFLPSYRAFVDTRYAQTKPKRRQSTKKMIVEKAEETFKVKEWKGPGMKLNRLNASISGFFNTYLNPASHVRRRRYGTDPITKFVYENAARQKAEAKEIPRAAYPTQHHISNLFINPLPEFGNVRTLIFDGWDSSRISFTEILRGLWALRGKSNIHETMTTLSVRYANIQRRNLLSLKLWEKWMMDEAEKEGMELVESNDYSTYYWKKKTTQLAYKTNMGDQDTMPVKDFWRLRPFALKNFYYYTPSLKDHCVIRSVLYTPPFPGRLLQRLRVDSDVDYCESWYVERPGLSLHRHTDDREHVHQAAEKRAWRCLFGPGGSEHTYSDKCRDGKTGAICRKCAQWRACWKCERIVCIPCMANQSRTSVDGALAWGWPTVQSTGSDVGAIERWKDAEGFQELYCRACRVADPGWVDASDYPKVLTSRRVQRTLSPSRTNHSRFSGDLQSQGHGDLPGPEPGWTEAVVDGIRVAALVENRAARGE